MYLPAQKSFTWVHTWNTRNICLIVSLKNIRIWFVRCNFLIVHSCYELYKALKSRHHAILTDVAIIYALNCRAREGLMKSSVVILASVLLGVEVWRSLAWLSWALSFVIIRTYINMISSWPILCTELKKEKILEIHWMKLYILALIP